MTNIKHVFAVALSVLLLASCGSREPALAENEAARAETKALDNASPSDPDLPNGSAVPGVDPVPPPDAVSHPDGYLPNVTGPEPASDSPPGSKGPPPATEDDYIRNRQAGS